MIKDSIEKLKKAKDSLQTNEIELEREEETLAEIQDSLKGMCNWNRLYFLFLLTNFDLMCRIDKTQVFQDKINIKQAELQPWTTRMNAKQSEIDVALSERDALAKKAEALKAQCEAADTTLKALQEEIGPKVCIISQLMLSPSANEFAGTD